MQPVKGLVNILKCTQAPAAQWNGVKWLELVQQPLKPENYPRVLGMCS